MKRCCRSKATMLVVLMSVFVLMGITTAQAASKVQVTSFAGWKSDSVGSGTPVTITPSGTLTNTKVTIKATGATGEIWGGLYDNNSTLTAIGMQATINISQVTTSTGSVQMGILQSLGMIGPQRIQASILYEANDKGTDGNTTQESRIRWRVRAKDTSVPGASWVVLATGTLADLWTSGYDLGTNITVSFTRVKNDINFSVSGTPYKVTWTSNKAMTSISRSPEVFGYANDGVQTIKGVIKNVYLLY